MGGGKRKSAAAMHGEANYVFLRAVDEGPEERAKRENRASRLSPHINQRFLPSIVPLHFVVPQ